MEQKGKTLKILRKQPPMRRVLLALLPCIVGSIYYFGWRSLVMIIIASIAGFLTEFFFCKKRGEPVTEAVFVTTVLFALVMPPTVSWLALIVGVVFAVFFSKEVFGGFGRNIFNPALAGRAFVYVCFPTVLTGMWAPASTQSWGALNKWSTASTVESVTSATPMAHLKAGRIIPAQAGGDVLNQEIPYSIEEKETYKVAKSLILKSLAFGRISGTMGVTSAVLITIGGIFLFITKTASRTTILSLIISYALFNWLFTFLGFERFYGPVYTVLGGGFLFGAFYMATDPVSSPKTEPARIIYGIIIGLCTTVIRNFSIFNGGLMFSILIGNMFAPSLDYAVKALKQKKTSQDGG